MLRKYSWLGLHVLLMLLLMMVGVGSGVVMADEEENPAIEDPPDPPPIEESRFAPVSVGGAVAFAPSSLAKQPDARKKIAALTASILADETAGSSAADGQKRYVVFSSLTPKVKHQVYTEASLPKKFRYGRVFFSARDKHRKAKKSRRDIDIQLRSKVAAPEPEPQQEDLATAPEPEPQQEDLAMAPEPEPQVEDLE